MRLWQVPLGSEHVWSVINVTGAWMNIMVRYPDAWRIRQQLLDDAVGHRDRQIQSHARDRQGHMHVHTSLVES